LQKATKIHEGGGKEIPYKEPELSRHSHPIASTNGSTGVGGVDGATGLNDLAAAALDGSGLRGAGGVLGCRLASSGSVGAGGAACFVVLLLAWLVSSCLGNGLGVLLVLVDSPVEDIVVLEALADKEITEDLAEVGVVRLVIEAEGSGVVEIDGELVGEPAAENLGGGGHLLLHDAVVLLLLGSSLQSLPGEGSTAEVEHNVTERLHVITTGLLCN
jgi:hypothetical protein